jgi:hypothetical protein
MTAHHHGDCTNMVMCPGLNIAPHFNQPYLSSSVSSFWGARWNLTAANTLRFMVYDTVCDGEGRPGTAHGLAAARGPSYITGLRFNAAN